MMVLNLHPTSLHPTYSQGHVLENTNLAANEEVVDTMPALKSLTIPADSILSIPTGSNLMQAAERLQNSALKRNEYL
jgi:hypothetical protein